MPYNCALIVIGHYLSNFLKYFFRSLLPVLQSNLVPDIEAEIVVLIDHHIFSGHLDGYPLLLYLYEVDANLNAAKIKKEGLRELGFRLGLRVHFMTGNGQIAQFLGC